MSGAELAEGASAGRGAAGAALASVTVGGYPGLEGDVTVELSPRRTVLVGRNGAGKSLLLDAIESVQAGPHHREAPAIPERFECTVARPGAGLLRYAFERNSRERAEMTPVRREAPPFELTERAFELRDEGWAELWRFEAGVVTIADGRQVRSVDGLLASVPFGSDDPLVDDHAGAIFSALAAVARISSGVPRTRHQREEVFHRVLPVEDELHPVHDRGQSTRLHRLSWEIAAEALRREPSEAFEALRASARRAGIAKSVESILYESSGKPGGPSASGVCEVRVDGVNIGLLSDGTLRVLETLLCLSRPGMHVLLEEPETGIHPGLLARLLREIEAYEGQVLISTHSPQVVSWAAPGEIRLVERSGGATSVRRLTPSELERVGEYLSRDGRLGEFVYGGALDDED